METLLYHGTGGRNLASILKNGIKPRGRSKGNWEQYPSRKDLVYLSAAYAPYFAWHSVESVGSERALIVEVDAGRLCESSILPDEDFIAQCMAQQLKVSISSIHRGIRDALEGYQHHALDSLTHLGNVSHKGAVQPSAITRYVTIDLKSQRDLAWACMDPSISLVNYKICGGKYRSIISWLFGDREDFEVGAGLPNNEYIEMMERLRPGYEEQVRCLFKNREGIEVHTHDR
jgi:hypothetical protein